jgi:hypothetical protein
LMSEHFLVAWLVVGRWSLSLVAWLVGWRKIHKTKTENSRNPDVTVLAFELDVNQLSTELSQLSANCQLSANLSPVVTLSPVTCHPHQLISFHPTRNQTTKQPNNQAACKTCTSTPADEKHQASKQASRTIVSRKSAQASHLSTTNSLAIASWGQRRSLHAAQASLKSACTWHRNDVRKSTYAQ